MRHTGVCLVLAVCLGVTAAAAPASKGKPPTLNPAVSKALQEPGPKGDFSRFRQLVASSPVNAVDTAGSTTLLLAVISGQADIVRDVLRRGANPNHVSNAGRTALALVPYDEPAGLPILKALLASGANPNTRKAGDRTPLMLAASMGAAEAARLLLAKGADPNAATSGGTTALHMAVELGHRDAAAALLSGGARVEAVTGEGITPLMTAALHGQPGAFQLLLTRGAKPRAKSRAGFPVLYYAAAGGNETILRALIKAGVDIRERFPVIGGVLTAALAQEPNADIRPLVELGADVNQADDEGVTPLMLAARADRPDTVRFLLSRGADVRRAARDGASALSYAFTVPAQRRNADLIAALRAAGAPTPEFDLPTAIRNSDLDAVRAALARGENPNQRVDYAALSASKAPRLPGTGTGKPADAAALTPLLRLALAQAEGEPVIVRELLKAGADPDVHGEDGVTPLMELAAAGALEPARLLLEHGARPNARDAQGLTPLFHAVQGGSPPLFELLLAGGANPNERLKNGATVLHGLIAVGRSQGYVPAKPCKLLVEKGVDVKATDANGVSVLELAAALPMKPVRDLPGAGGVVLWNKQELVEFLLAQGADARRRPESQPSALHHVVGTWTPGSPSQEAVLRALLRAGANPNSHTADLPAPLGLAAGLGHLTALKTLLAAGAEPNYAGQDGVTALMIASEESTDAVRLLLDSGAAPGARAADGTTALLLAARKGNVQAVRLLLQRKADPNVRGPQGLTPLKAAQGAARAEIVKLLKGAGAR